MLSNITKLPSSCTSETSSGNSIMNRKPKLKPFRNTILPMQSISFKKKFFFMLQQRDKDSLMKFTLLSHDYNASLLAYFQGLSS